MKSGNSLRVGAGIVALTALCAFLVQHQRHHGSSVSSDSANSLTRWSVGIYEGGSPFSLVPAAGVRNPVLAASDVTDIPARYVADPFLVHEGRVWYLFLEVMNSDTKRGCVGFATSTDARNWKYKQVVLTEPFHLSYPYVFKWADEYYMIPESRAADSVRLYRAAPFPTHWKFVKKLATGRLFDSSIIRYHEHWWLFAGMTGKARNDVLRLYHADNLLGPWKEHPKSPIIPDDASRARPGGRFIVWKNCVIRFAQNDLPIYGSRVRAFEVTTLTKDAYAETELPRNPVLKGSGRGWNGGGMHTIDAEQIAPGRWIASVDGRP